MSVQLAQVLSSLLKQIDQFNPLRNLLELHESFIVEVYIELRVQEFSRIHRVDIEQRLSLHQCGSLEQIEMFLDRLLVMLDLE